ncbi:MAG: hypothetical protein M5T61_09850 [Acidimicrobiia bacterium]|nr:hypothetical protein [Acidimicrobiia bacterium]
MKPSSGSTPGELFVDYSGAEVGLWRWSGSAWTQVANIGGSTTIPGDYPSISAIRAASPNAPALSSGSFRIQAGSYVAPAGGSNGLYTLPLSGPINGYVTLSRDGRRSRRPRRRPGDRVPLVIDDGSSPIITVRVAKHDGATFNATAVRLNYFVMHW